MARPVAVTGMGLVTPLGADIETAWKRALAGESGVRSIRSFDASGLPVSGAGEVSAEEMAALRARLPEEFSGEGERRVLFALDAAQSAFAGAGLAPGEIDPLRAGVVMGTGLGTYRMEDFAACAAPEGKADWPRFAREAARAHPGGYFKNPPERATSLIARFLGLAGPAATLTSACAAAAQAVGLGMRMIRRGEADVVLCGGADSMIHPLGMAIFLLLGAASTAAGPPESVCRPFDRRRSGLVVGEGAGVVVLESEEHAARRGAEPHALLCGYGASMDAYQVTAPDPRGGGAARAMAGALRDAGAAPGEIAYVNAHGTGTRLNDPAETLAIKEVFGDAAKRLAVSSTKSLIGHLIAACGGPELIFTVLSVQRGVVHPTRNLENPDPKCDLDCVPGGAREMPVAAAISNSFGFGGQNAALVVRKAA
ncbi:MAG: beta-ketoacyl-[acyl-carrier-protein] synthase family protein [Candidatus Tectomicrobia bacterium]|uniref:Beta-ketoacyl-[acyl-carrier-protein] synthase family protein n=1 Tax=Tectimicrobiota bacterium TaxID=2528274 RepID=A0A932ML44_UNCTE|nr:beta-ketoacyl-[acyl-carrier-protein] synthase family protein [Candidatus Tectomicrobia bacterium]